MVRRIKLPVERLRGSWAGAMGRAIYAIDLPTVRG